MKPTVPSAHVVFTVRWLIAMLIRVWVLLEIVKQAPGPIGNAQRVFVEYARQYSYIRSLGFTNGGPQYPPIDTLSVTMALVTLVMCSLVFVPVAIWAGWLAKSIAPVPSGAGLAPLGTGRLRTIRLTAWWWSMILLRLWSLRMVALMAFPIASVFNQHIIIADNLLNGRMPPGVSTVSDVIWLGIRTAVLETWVSFTIAASLWFFAGRLGRFLTAEPVTPCCPSCGYRATTPTCPECGTPLRHAVET